MSQQIKPSVTNPTIAAIYKMIERNELTLQPDFQKTKPDTHVSWLNFSQASTLKRF